MAKHPFQRGGEEEEEEEGERNNMERIEQPGSSGKLGLRRSRKHSFGFGLGRGKKTSDDDGDLPSSESKGQSHRVSRHFSDAGSFLPEEAWRTDNVEKMQRTTQLTEITPPFQVGRRTASRVAWRS